VSAVDLDVIKAKWLKLCPPCDVGVPGTCVCPDADPRPVIEALVGAIERLGSQLDDAAAELLNARAKRDERTATVVSLEEAIAVVRKLCGDYTPVPPPLFRGPGLSEHGVGYNAGTRDIAQAVLGTIGTALNPDSGDDE
jgi:hypothetical protein